MAPADFAGGTLGKLVITIDQLNWPGQWNPTRGLHSSGAGVRLGHVRTVLFYARGMTPGSVGINTAQDSLGSAWPQPPRDWDATRATFHLWTQVIGKIRLACTPVISHWWNAPLYVTASGLTTSLVPDRAGRGFQIDLDLIDHQLIIATTDGVRRAHPLGPQSVADFYRAVMGLLDELDLSVDIWTMPVEIEGAIPFDQDHEHASYDSVAVQRSWRALIESQRIFELFRHRYLGKTSSVHLFWGALDLASSRFSGRAAPLHRGGASHCGPHVMHEAYSREVSSCGYWPGPNGEGSYYSYAYPEPDGFSDATVLPAEAGYDLDLGEFTLAYKAVQTASDPDVTLLQFLQSTYDVAADLASGPQPARTAGEARIGAQPLANGTRHATSIPIDLGAPGGPDAAEL